MAVIMLPHQSLKQIGRKVHTSDIEMKKTQTDKPKNKKKLSNSPPMDRYIAQIITAVKNTQQSTYQ